MSYIFIFHEFVIFNVIVEIKIEILPILKMAIVYQDLVRFMIATFYSLNIRPRTLQHFEVYLDAIKKNYSTLAEFAR